MDINAYFCPKNSNFKMKIIDLNRNRVKPNLEKSLVELLNEYMERLSISKNKLGQILSINKNSLEDILSGKTVDIKMNHLLKIMTLLEIDESYIADYCYANLEDEEVTKINQIKKTNYLLNNFDLDSLKKEGFIKSTKNLEEIESRIIEFFGLKTIFDYTKFGENVPLFSQSSLSVTEKKKTKMLSFWVQTVKLSFESIDNPNDYNEELLLEFIAKRLKTFSLDERYGFITVISVLFKLGVTVLVQPYLTSTTAYGVSMFVKGKPCIVLTDQGKKYHLLWSTLLHELYHIINDADYLKKVSCLISGSEHSDLFVDEHEADLFASNALVGPKALSIASKVINYDYKIGAMAEKLKVHKSIVYGQYLESLDSSSQKKEFPKYQKYLLRSDIAVKRIIFNPIGHRTIKEAANIVKEQIQKVS